MAGASAALAAAPALAQARRPNLVLFFLDELRADALACYGNRSARCGAPLVRDLK